MTGETKYTIKKIVLLQREDTMSPLNLQKWAVPCARCQRNEIVISELWDFGTELFICFDYERGSHVKFMERDSDGKPIFLVICPRCKGQIDNSSKSAIIILECTKCHRPLLIVSDPDTGEAELFGGEADISVIWGRPIVALPVCNFCIALSHK